MPFLTTGSLINFCDVLMAGGTSRKNHSEIGSSYVHFNYTPSQDKATASLLGDVPRGVMLDQPPIFLGGQGGLVGPARIAYGTVLAAGTIQRGDQLTENHLVYGRRKEGESPRAPGFYRHAAHLVANNVLTIASLHALRQWYLHARARFLQATAHGTACHAGALRCIDSTLADRIQRLGDVVERFARPPAGDDPRSDAERRHQQALAAAWPDLRAQLAAGAPADTGADCRAQLLAALPACPAPGAYIETIQSLAPASRRSGTCWLQAIVDAITALTPEEA
jgi:UDP-N-acetylglucosamine/UDP-N-acetylgalactosamine diphosphorylase